MEREESDLYGLPLDEFVPRRTELERRLRKDGERERAAAVKKLPKPSVAAWAVNQASRSQPKDRRELLAASADLREAQERLIAGDASAADLEKAAARQRAAIDALVDAASGLLTSDGKSIGETTLARVRETLAAVAADDELASLVEAGTLDRERRSAGLGFGFGLADRDADDSAATVAAEPPAKAGGKGSGKGGGAGRRGKPGSAKAGAGRAGSTTAGPRGAGSAKDPGSAGHEPAAPKETAKERKAREKAAKRAEKELRAARERVKEAKGEEREAARRQKAAERDARKAAEALDRAERAVEKARRQAETARDELDAANAAQQEAASAREAAQAEVERLG